MPNHCAWTGEYDACLIGMFYIRSVSADMIREFGPEQKIPDGEYVAVFNHNGALIAVADDEEGIRAMAAQDGVLMEKLCKPH